MFRLFLFLIFSSICTLVIAKDEFADGHPLISAYKGANLTDYKAMEYFDAGFPLAPVPEDIDKGHYLNVGGQAYFYKYDTPEGSSVKLVAANYKQALNQAGMELLFECGPQNCGKGIVQLIEFTKRVSAMYMSFSENSQLMLYKASEGQQNTYVLVAVYDALYGARAYQIILHEQALQTGKVAVDKDYLQKQVNNHGRVVLEGLNFDTDSAVLKDESLAVVEAIAEYLKISKGMKFYIVGHTDDTGSEQHNLKLSKDRAETVQALLVKQFKINPDRLKARGAGPWAPKASNKNQQGRGLNRRVELVLSNH